MTQIVNTILGYASDTEIAQQLHALGHRGSVETVLIQPEDILRRRLRIQTDQGSEFLLALPRDQQLSDGAVLLLEEDRAVVVRMAQEQWLSIRPRDISSAIKLGYFIGNLHWRVRFEDADIVIALEGPASDYLSRLQPYLQTGRAIQITPN